MSQCITVALLLCDVRMRVLIWCTPGALNFLSFGSLWQGPAENRPGRF